MPSRCPLAVLGAIVLLGHLLMVTFGVWIAVSHAIYVANFGYQEIQPFSVPCADNRNPTTQFIIKIVPG
jgi:uncharacterized membrane protein